MGIPHVVFTGGEPTLRPDLPELVAHAEKNGQITGLNTNARRLSDTKYVDNLVASGLDHVQITVAEQLSKVPKFFWAGHRARLPQRTANSASTGIR